MVTANDVEQYLVSGKAVENDCATELSVGIDVENDAIASSVAINIKG